MINRPFNPAVDVRFASTAVVRFAFQVERGLVAVEVYRMPQEVPTKRVHRL